VYVLVLYARVWVVVFMPTLHNYIFRQEHRITVWDNERFFQPLFGLLHITSMWCEVIVRMWCDVYIYVCDVKWLYVCDVMSTYTYVMWCLHIRMWCEMIVRMWCDVYIYVCDVMLRISMWCEVILRMWCDAYIYVCDVMSTYMYVMWNDCTYVMWCLHIRVWCEMIVGKREKQR